MRAALARGIRWAVYGAIAAALAALIRPGERPLVLDAYLLYAGAIGLALLVRATRLAAPDAGPSRFERALRRRPQPAGRPDELASLEREVLMATHAGGDFYFRLRPVLVDIAEHRAATRLGVGLASPRARHALGEAWPLVRPDLEPPEERFGPGVPLDDLRAAVAALERM